MRRCLPIIAMLCLVSILLGISIQPAEAHGYLVRSIPQDRTTVSKAPSRVQIWFSEGLEPTYSTLTVTNQRGDQIDLGDGGVNPVNRAQLSARLPPNLPDGAYIATMRIAFASDGHLQTDTLVFWVGEKGADFATASSTQDIYPVEVIARAFLTIGLLVVFGALFSYRFGLYPAWSNPMYRAGGLAPRVMRRLYEIALSGMGAAVIGNVIWLFEQSGVLFAADLGRVLRDSLWLTTLNTTQFGDIWKLRLILIGATGGIVGAAAGIAKRQPGLVYTLLSVALVVAVAALGTLSLASHAPGATLWPFGAIAVDWLHLTAAAAWVGGLIALVWVLPVALHPLDREGRRLALLAILRRFSPIGLVAVGLMAASGAYAAFTYVYTPAQIAESSYGRTLFAKTLLVAPLLLFGLAHNRALQPERYKAASGWLDRSLRIESAVGLSVLLAAALLTATPPPIPPDARAKADLATHIATLGDISMNLTPNPGGVGSNSYDVKLTRAGLPLDGATMTAQFVFPELDKRSALLPFDSLGDGLYGAAGAELNRPGYWQALFNVTLRDEASPVRLAVGWLLPAQAAAGAERQPNVMNGLAAGSLIVVFGLWAAPPTRQKVLSLKLDAQGIMIGVGVTALTVVVLIGATVAVASSAQAFEMAANPRPQVVNTVLPDQGSITRGQQLTAICDLLQNARLRPADYLKARGDSALFSELKALTTPGCATLNDADLWNVINAARFRVAITP